MEVQHPFYHRSELIASTLATYPPHSAYTTITATPQWREIPLLSPPPILADDAYPSMHHLRFPTPPITPPHNKSAVAALVASKLNPAVPQCNPVRTQSVIMRVGQVDQDRSPQHITNESPTIQDDANTNNSHEGRSSDSSSPATDYVCDWIDCGKYFESLESLAAHVTKIHAVASPIDSLYYCRWSGCVRTRGFNARYKMLVHVRTHTKEKPHQCQLCEKTFSRAENLKIHIRSHSGEKPYVCTYEGCHKAYSNSSDRFKHTRTHSMEKPYMCKVPGCQKRYTDPSSLRKHVKTFKHAVQMLPAVVPHVSGSNSQQSSASQLGALSSDTVTSIMDGVSPWKMDGKNEAHATAYLCLPHPTPLPPAQAAHYYVGMEDICQLKATQLDGYYYATDPATAAAAANYWLTHEQMPIHNAIEPLGPLGPYHSGYSLHNQFGIGKDLETPLDLRVSRR